MTGSIGGRSPESDAFDPIGRPVDEDALPGAHMPDVFGEGVRGEVQGDAGVGDDRARATFDVERRNRGLHVPSVPTSLGSPL